MGAFLLPVVILLVGTAAAEERVWRLGVPAAMVPELAAFGADHDQRT